MEEGTVVPLPRPGATLADDPLLAVLREGARRMLTQAVEAEVEAFLAAHPASRMIRAAGVWCATGTRRSGTSRRGSARSRSAVLPSPTIARQGSQSCGVGQL